MATDFIDPFDEPEAAQPKRQKTGRDYGFVDPFDEQPQARRDTGGRDVRGGSATGQRPPTPTEQQRQQILSSIQTGTETSADAATIAKTSFADDPEIIVREFAKKRFPDMPVDEAMDRYAIIDDKIVYKGEDGGLYTEVPEGWSPEALAKRGASLAGPAIPFATSGAAGVATAPMLVGGPAGAAASIGLTSAAGAGGEAIRQYAGEKMMGDPVSAADIATEGAISGAGQGLAKLGVKFMGRKVADDIGRLNMNDAARLQSIAGKQGVTLTPAELTNLPSLKARQKALGNLVDTADDLGDFYVKRADDIGEAMGRQLDAISPVDSAEEAGAAVRGAANKAMSEVAKRRADAARPLYESAFRSGQEVNVKPVLSFIDRELKTAKGEAASTLKKARSFLMKAGDDAGGEAIDTSVEGLHQAKLAIRDLIEKRGDTAIGNTARGKLKQVQSRLLNQLNKIDDYKEANKVFADLSPETTQVREGLVGVIADLKDRDLQKTASKLFNFSQAGTTVGPKSVRMAKEQLKSADPEAWQAIKRAWLQEAWENAGREFATSGGKVGQGAKFRALIMGDARRKRVLKEILEPDEYQAVSDLSEVMSAASRVRPVGSDTAWNQEMMRAWRDEATPTWAKAIGTSISPQDWGRMVKDWAAENSLKGQARKTLEIITSPDSLAKLKELKKVSPRSAKAASIVGQALGILPDAASAGDERIGPQVTQEAEQAR